MPEVVLTSHKFHMVIKQLEHLPQMCQKNAQQLKKTEGNILSGFIKYTKVNI